MKIKGDRIVIGTDLLAKPRKLSKINLQVLYEKCKLHLSLTERRHPVTSFVRISHSTPFLSKLTSVVGHSHHKMYIDEH